jgi:hypothetical protein
LQRREQRANSLMTVFLPHAFPSAIKSSGRFFYVTSLT